MVKTLFFMLLFSALHGYEPAFRDVNDPKFFETFKSDPIAGKFYEPVPYEEGAAYLNELLFSFDHLLPALKEFKENDLIGSPRTFVYKQVGRISPSSIRWMTTAGHLATLFEDLDSYRILYFGAGYGGVCKALFDLGFSPKIDLVQNLGEALFTQKYLQAFGVYNVRSILPSEIADSYDLVIVDSDFVDRALLGNDLDGRIAKIARGYVVKRGVQEQFNALIAELMALGRKGKASPELYFDENVRQRLYWMPEGEGKHDLLPPSVYLANDDGVQMEPAITNGFSNERLGDQLLTLFRAKWIARKRGLPFVLSPFPFADAFAFYATDSRVGAGPIFRKKKEISSLDFLPAAKSSMLWSLPFCPLSREEFVRKNWHAPYVQVDWEHPLFKEELRQALAPVHPVEEIVPPKDRISIALHLRKGGGYPLDDKLGSTLPLKFPADSFMLQQLRRTIEILPKEPLYIYLFTDSDDPKGLLEFFRMNLNEERAVFDCREKVSYKDSSLLFSDFYSFKNFDCVVRPISHFSFFACRLGDLALEVAPAHFSERSKGEYAIDQTELIFQPINRGIWYDENDF